MGVVIVEGKGAVLGVNLEVGTSIVTNGEFVAYSSAKIRESIELSFGVVSGVGRGIGVLEGIRVPKGKGDFEDFSPYWF